MLFDLINERTGFANGDLFDDEIDVRKYFTVESMNSMFGDDHDLSQEELDEMAKYVILNKWHMKKELSKVFSIRINSDESNEDTNAKIDEMVKKIRDFKTSISM